MADKRKITVDMSGVVGDPGILKNLTRESYTYFFHQMGHYKIKAGLGGGRINGKS